MVRDALNRVLQPLGGMAAFVGPGARVLVKPNLMAPLPSGRAATTHPEVVRAAVLEILECGGTPLLGDSPAVGSLGSVLKMTGTMRVVRELGIETVPFGEAVLVPTARGGVYRSLKLASRAVEADLIINLPKFKTHSMMTLSLAVKNMFGTVVGASKPGWHLQAKDHLRFADMLLDLWRTVPPALSIMDGVWAMEGRGPSSGDRLDLGLVMASPSALAMDCVAGRIAGVEPERHPVLYQARVRKLEGSTERDIRVLGEKVEDVRRPFALPKSTARVDFKLPEWVRRSTRKSINSFPELDAGRCIACGSCAATCPTRAITLYPEPRVGGTVSKDRCISCFCCLEVCPEKAVDIVPGRLLRVLKKVNLA